MTDFESYLEATPSGCYGGYHPMILWWMSHQDGMAAAITIRINLLLASRWDYWVKTHEHLTSFPMHFASTETRTK